MFTSKTVAGAGALGGAALLCASEGGTAGVDDGRRLTRLAQTLVGRITVFVVLGTQEHLDRTLLALQPNLDTLETKQRRKFI